jgi:hypothetical protein
MKQDGPRPRSSRPHGTINVQDRVRQLEDMVLTLLNNQTRVDQDVLGAKESPSDTSIAVLANEDDFNHPITASSQHLIDPTVPKTAAGKFTKEKDQMNFVGNEHWEAILEDITELKIDLETPKTHESADFKPHILFGVERTSRSELISSIPPRQVCDMLISRWFKSMDMAPSKFTMHPANNDNNEILRRAQWSYMCQRL